MIRTRFGASLPAAFLLLSGLGHADLTAWLAAVASGTPAAYLGTSQVIPAVVDLGVISNAQGLTYEFVVNATNDGLSSTLMGVRGTGVGTDSAFKFEQYADTQQFGLTESGVADWLLGPNTVGQDLHVVFVVDPVAGSTELYLDGVNLGSAPHAPHMTGQVGLGQWWSPTSVVDLLTGVMHGTAVYEAMMPAAEILEHSNAYLHGFGAVGVNYCFSLLNSTGSPAQISAYGSLDLSWNSLRLEAHGVPDNIGLFYYGAASLLQTFGNGYRCVSSGGVGLQRLPVILAANHTLSHDLDLTAPPTAAGMILPGSTWYFQAWYSDPLGGGAGFNLSDGLELQFQ